ncbi:MAG TPA: hypothetical protein VM737_11335 [Gemmatimonadota bacterium]|nr:hypothetical protein [Gemmatimonadota bacterium]
MIGTDMMRPVLYFFDPGTDRMVTFDLTRDPKWPGGAPLHTVVVPDGDKAYLSVMSSETDPLMILSLRVGEIGWDAGTADVSIANVIRVAEPGTVPSMVVPEQTKPEQPITALWKPTNQQLHGPTVLPNGRFVYFGQWTDDKIRVVDVSKDALAAVDPVHEGPLTRQIHGVFFNPSGTRAISTGYYFDLYYVTLFRVDPQLGDLEPARVIALLDDDERTYAAMTHFVEWLDDRRALTATQQVGPTSLTPTGTSVMGPSVWLIDAEEGTARMVIPPTDDVQGEGIYKGASDLIIVGDKLYVGEEDTTDDEIDASYVSVWDIRDPLAPKFLKRLSPGEGLPEGWTVSHEFYRTPDGLHLYVQSWHSGHLVKIDPATDEVIKVWSKEDGFVMPHGNFIVGNLR